MYNEPLAYFITFRTYGSWLHGDERGSLVVKNDCPEWLGRNDILKRRESESMKFAAVAFDDGQCRIVLETILKHCEIRGWKLFAANVRSNHVHVVVKADAKPDKVMSELKAWCTRKLREGGFGFEKVWAKKGSTKFIFTVDKLKEKIHYVINEQGEGGSSFDFGGVV